MNGLEAKAAYTEDNLVELIAAFNGVNVITFSYDEHTQEHLVSLRARWNLRRGELSQINYSPRSKGTNATIILSLRYSNCGHFCELNGVCTLNRLGTSTGREFSATTQIG